MKLLVIGGSYFYGRVFTMLSAKEHDITVVNRGTYSMESFGVTQISGDRRNAALWKNCNKNYDVIIDFCGYEKGDITTVLKNISGKIKQYIFVSTVDVYARENGRLLCENAPYAQTTLPGEAGAYIAGKIALEQELGTECRSLGIPYTILRPAILYGPYNYAPRESVYIQMLVQNHVLPYITDAAGKFQFVYVKDAARAIQKCLLNTDSYCQSYNLCGDPVLDYKTFCDALKSAADVPFEIVPMTMQQAFSQNIPLPFPLTADETQLYSGEKSRTALGLSYTQLSEGIAKTYNAFKNVYLQNET